MFTLFDFMRGAQGEAGLDTLARQFALSREQTQQTIAALAPAFALGIQRNMMDPAAMMRFWSLMASGQFTPFADPARAASHQGMTEGQQALGALFGSQELNRQIVQQVATVTGVTTEVIRQMLPVLAAMMIGMLARTAEGAGWTGSPEPARAPEPPSPPNVADLWADMVKSMFGSTAFSGSAATGTKPPAPTPAPAGLPPMAPNFGDMMRFFTPGAAMPPASQEEFAPSMDEEEPEARRPTAPLAKAAPKRAGTGARVSGKAGTRSAGRTGTGSHQRSGAASSAAPDNPAQVWSQIMQTSSDVGQQHLANLQDLFASYWGMDSRNR